MDRLKLQLTRNALDRRLPIVLVSALALAGCEGFCRSEPPPPPPVPTVKGPDGREYVLLVKGGKPTFDAKGLLDRVEYDRNGDGRPDQIAHHNGQRTPEVLDNDDDFDGVTDNWLYYNPAGVLVKIGSSRKGGTQARRLGLYRPRRQADAPGVRRRRRRPGGPCRAPEGRARST
jgi:hypothetical protein